MIRRRQELEESLSYQRKCKQKRLLATPEGRILEIGLVMGLLFITALGLGYLRFQEKAHVFLGMSATNILFGRAAGISFGYAVGLSNIFVIATNILIESILVLIFYPLFVFSWRSLVVIKSLSGIMNRTLKVAEVHQSKIQRFGLIGLFIFVWFPFWMTGPLAGCAVGFLLGLRPWLNITIVLSSTCLATVCWATFLRKIHERIAEYGPYAPIFLVVIIILIVCGTYIMQYLRHKY